MFSKSSGEVLTGAVESVSSNVSNVNKGENCLECCVERLSQTRDSS